MGYVPVVKETFCGVRTDSCLLDGYYNLPSATYNNPWIGAE